MNVANTPVSHIIYSNLTVSIQNVPKRNRTTYKVFHYEILVFGEGGPTGAKGTDPYDNNMY